MLFKGLAERGSRLAAAVACLLLTGLAAAAPIAGGDGSLGRQPARGLLALCENGGGTTETAAAQRCRAFIDGFVWGHAWAAWRGGTDMWFCLPAAWTVEELVFAVTNYLESHPERLDDDAHLLMFTALSHAYPCRP